MRPQARGWIQLNPETFPPKVGSGSCAMDPNDFRPGVVISPISFRALITSSTGPGCFEVQLLTDGPMASHLITNGQMKLSVERAIFLNLQPGRTFVAYKVIPSLGYDEMTNGKFFIDLGCDSSSGQILMTTDRAGDPFCIDLCSGMGGWSIGARHAGIRFSVHIEKDRDVAEAGSKVTFTQLVTKEWIRDCSFQTWNNMLQTGVTIIMPFQDDTCWEKLAASGVDLVAASLPCPPWSGLTAQQGLMSEAGRLFDDLVQFVACFQPQVLALENVEGLIMHEHWRHIVEKFRDVGFVVVHMSVDKLDHICPMQRSRASVILINNRHIDAFEKCVLNDVPLPQLVLRPNPLTAGAIHQNISSELEPFVKINSEDCKLLKNPKYWPRYWKTNYPLDCNGLIDLRDRVHVSTKPLPCAVAKYGFPTTLHESGLHDKGLVMKLLQTNGKIRWISPFEHLTAMGWPIATLIPRQVQLARMIIGNTISPVHALVTLARVVLILPSLAVPEKRKLSFFDLVTPLLSVVPKLPACEIHSDDEYLWLQPFVPSPGLSMISDGGGMQDITCRHDGQVTCVAATQLDTTQLDPPTQPGCVTDDISCDEPPVKRPKIEFPVFAASKPQPVICPIDDLPHGFVFQTSIPSNIFQIGLRDDFGCDSSEATYLWKGNALSTPHVLHEVIHADGATHEVLVPDTWITGTISRSHVNLSNGDLSTTTDRVVIQDAFASWECCIDIDPKQDIRCVVQQVAPHLRPDLVFQLRLNDVVSRWSTKVASGNLVIVPIKLKRVIIVPERFVTLTLYCDHFDSVESIMSEHPILQSFGRKTCWFHLDLKSQQVVMMEPGDFILDFPFRCWALRSDHHITRASMSLEIPSCVEQEPLNVDTLHRPGKVACIHPFTGKTFEFPLASVASVCELLDLVQPAVPSDIDVHAEVDGRRIDMTTASSDIDTRKIIRFRFFGLKGGAPTINRIRTELMAHGVPESQASTRAKAVITALGEPVVHDILQTSDPWAAMKTNCRDKNLRLVLFEELKQHQQVMRSASRNRPDRDSASASSDGVAACKRVRVKERACVTEKLQVFWTTISILINSSFQKLGFLMMMSCPSHTSPKHKWNMMRVVYVLWSLLMHSHSLQWSRWALIPWPSSLWVMTWQLLQMWPTSLFRSPWSLQERLTSFQLHSCS